MKRVTIKDIAHHLRLSPSTVSRALAGDKNIRKETREIIDKAADELGYRRNRFAVSLRSGRSGIIGLIVGNMEEHSELELIAGVEKVLHNGGFHLMVANSEDIPSREWSNLRMMEDARVDGLIIEAIESGDNIEEFVKIKKTGIHTVFVNEIPAGVSSASVSWDSSGEDPDYFRLGEEAALLMREIIAKGGAPIARVVAK